MAFTIEEDFQGQGLAGRRLAALADVARRRGIARIKAEVLTGNATMLAVTQRSGWPTHTQRSGATVLQTLTLGSGAPPA